MLHDAVVNLLLARDDIEVNLKNNLNRTPLLSAAENGHDAVVNLLLARAERTALIQRHCRVLRNVDMIRR
jgi:ankyrin repeat protein